MSKEKQYGYFDIELLKDLKNNYDEILTQIALTSYKYNRKEKVYSDVSKEWISDKFKFCYKIFIKGYKKLAAKERISVVKQYNNDSKQKNNLFIHNTVNYKIMRVKTQFAETEMNHHAKLLYIFLDFNVNRTERVYRIKNLKELEELTGYGSRTLKTYIVELINLGFISSDNISIIDENKIKINKNRGLIHLTLNENVLIRKEKEEIVKETTENEVKELKKQKVVEVIKEATVVEEFESKLEYLKNVDAIEASELNDIKNFFNRYEKEVPVELARQSIFTLLNAEKKVIKKPFKNRWM